MFISTWGDFATCLDQIKANIGRSHRLISSNVSFKELEEMLSLRANSLHTFKTNKTAEDISRRATIIQWLSSYNCEAEQARHRKTRSVCKSPGQWLLNNSRFHKWSAPEFCSDPFLWLNGIPGAGKPFIKPPALMQKFRTQFGLRQDYPCVSYCRSFAAQISWYGCYILLL